MVVPGGLGRGSRASPSTPGGVKLAPAQLLVKGDGPAHAVPRRRDELTGGGAARERAVAQAVSVSPAVALTVDLGVERRWATTG